MAPKTAYISASSVDLKDYRSAALDLLRQYGFEANGMELYDKPEDSVVRKCQSDAAAADFLILLIAFRYGQKREDFDGKSITELEYEAARAAKRPVYAFLLDEAKTLDTRLDDRFQLADRGADVERFRKRVLDQHLAKLFLDSLDSFREVFELSLRSLQREDLEAREKELDRRTVAGTPEAYALKEALQNLLDSEPDFEASYVPLAGRTTMPRSDGRWGDALDDPRSEGADELVELEDVREALGQHSQFYLVGEPGGGKTETLKALEREAARRFLANPRAPFPLRLDISTWLPDQQDFISLIADEMRTRSGVWPFPPERLLLLLDGAIDSAALRADDAIERIGAWLKAHPRCEAVLAVRLRTPRAVSLPVVRIHQMNDDRVRRFVINAVGGEDKAATLLENIGWNRPAARSSRDISALMRNPFNLRLVCALQTTNNPPTTQGDLIRRVVRRKLADESKRLGITTSAKAFVDAFGAVAIASIQDRKHLGANIGEVMELVSDPGEVIDILRLAFGCQVIQPRKGRNTSEFAHRLYLEYLAAEYVHANPEKLEEILTPPRYEGGQRLAQRFDEVIHTLLELEPSVALLKIITASDPFLAAECLPAFQPGDERADAEIAVAKALVDVLRTPNNEGLEVAAAALADIGPSAIEFLRRSMHGFPRWVRRAAVRTLARIPHIDAVYGVVRSLADTNKWVRDDAFYAIERFDADSRRLLLALIRSPRWKSDGHDHSIDEQLVAMFNERDPEMTGAIFEVTGIRAEVQPEPVAPPPPAIEVEPEEDVAARQMPSVSWGFGWLDEWQADPGNANLRKSAFTWLRTATKRDAAWGYVWTALWRNTPGDHGLETLGRQWIEHAQPDAGSWAHLWMLLHRAKPADSLFTTKALHWLREVEASQPGWPIVWNELWRRNESRTELTSLGYWWLDAAAPSADNWSQVWQPLWEKEKSATLAQIASRWMRDAPVESKSWGYVWPNLWKYTRGTDEELRSIGMNWLEHASASHPAWDYIFHPLWDAARSDENLEAIGRRWLDQANPSHHSWGHVFETLCQRYRADDLLHEQGLRWLTNAPLRHAKWTRIWQKLWDDPKSDRGVLAQLGARWIGSEEGRRHGFSFVWERLWEHEPSEDLRELARSWLATAGRDRTWLYVWEKLRNADPNDPSLVELAERHLDELDAVDWGLTWRTLADMGRSDEAFLGRGVKWLERHPPSSPTSRGYAYVWTYFVDRNADRQLLDRGWEWIGAADFDRRTWPIVWEALWTHAPEGRDRLAILAADFLSARGATAAARITRWREVAEHASLDEPRRANVRAFLTAR